MSFFPDITPLTDEVKQLNQKLDQMIDLLKEIKETLNAK